MAKVIQAVVDVGGSIDPSLGKSLDEVSKHLEKVNWTAVAAGAAVAGIAVATGKAVVSATKHLARLGNDFNKAMNQIASSTGATGAELEEMGEIVKDVYARGLGESLGNVAEGLESVRRVTNLTGEELEAATVSAFVLSDTFGYEIGESARAADALMKNFGLSAEEAYGLIAVGAQNGADKNGDLLDTLNEYSGQYAALGLSADQFMQSLVSGADAGLWSIDKIGDAVKEFNIRAKDGSDSSRDAFGSLGLDADTMFQAFAAGGESAQAAFFDTVEALNSLDDPLARNQIAVSLFGTQFEDLEAGILPVLAGVEAAALDGAQALEKINKVKYDDIGVAFEQIKRSAEVVLLPMASMIANMMTDLMPIIKDVMESIIPVIEQVMAASMPFVEEFLKGMGEVLKEVGPMVAELAAALLPMLTDLMASLLPPILELLRDLMPPLMQIMKAILPPITNLLLKILPALTQIASLVLPVLAEVTASLLPIITPLLDLATQLLNTVIMPLLPPIIQLAKAILPPVMAMLNAMMPTLVPILGILSPIVEVLGTIVGYISKVVGWVSGGLSWVANLFTGDTKTEVPEGYAAGGFTNGLSIAGEDPRYPTEAVLSFNPAYRSQNLAYWAQAGQMLGASDSDSSNLLSGSSGPTVVYDLSGLSFSPKVEVKGNIDDENELIRKLKQLEPEFVDFVLEALARREEGAYVTADNRIY